VADVLEAERDRLPKMLAPQLERLASVSRALRRDRELAFYGAEDLTPSSFYREHDAVIARDSARDVVALVQPHVSGATVALRVTSAPPNASAGAENK
jgi:hypothetical protein